MFDHKMNIIANNDKLVS